MVFNKPTYGLDIAPPGPSATRIRELADDGVSALVISTDLDELVALCDRIAVLCRGRLAGVIENGPGVEQRIGQLMIGQAAPARTAAA